jgi:hypothetical protein
VHPAAECPAMDAPSHRRGSEALTGARRSHTL